MGQDYNTILDGKPSCGATEYFSVSLITFFCLYRISLIFAVLFLGNSSEVVTAVRVEFLEEKEKIRVTKTNTWKIKNLEENFDEPFDSIEVGQRVRSYWSPDKHFYPARVVEVATRKLA